MKKIISVALAALSLVALWGCAGEPAETEPTYNLTAPADYEHAADAKFWGDYEKSEHLPLWYQVSGHEIYMDVPNWNFRECDETDAFLTDDYCIAVTATKYADFTSLESTHSTVMAKFIANTQDLLNLEGESVTEAESIDFHGIDVYKVSGEIQFNGKAVHLTSYTFVLDGMAVNISGLMRKEAPSSDETALLEEITEDIVRSVRNTSEWTFAED